MNETGLLDSLSALISPEIAVMGFEILDMEYSRGVLKLTIDKPAGVSLDDCVAVTRRVGLLLDTRDPIEGSYRLEVSSPGLTRRLKTEKDFEHFTGRMVKIQTKDNSYKGTIKGLAGDAVLLVVDGSEISLQMKDIVKANLDFDF